jgi:hypothetical protein
MGRIFGSGLASSIRYNRQSPEAFAKTLSTHARVAFRAPKIGMMISTPRRPRKREESRSPSFFRDGTCPYYRVSSRGAYGAGKGGNSDVCGEKTDEVGC